MARMCSRNVFFFMERVRHDGPRSAQTQAPMQSLHWTLLMQCAYRRGLSIG